MLKILQARLQQWVNQEPQLYKLDLEEAEEPEIKFSTSIGSQKKQGNSRKGSTSASLTTLKLLILWITTNCGKFFKRLESQTTLPASWETKKQELEPAMEQGTGSKLGKEYIKAIYQHPAYLTYMQSMRNSVLGQLQGGIKIVGRNINNLRNADSITLMAENEEWKRLLM